MDHVTKQTWTPLLVTGAMGLVAGAGLWALFRRGKDGSRGFGDALDWQVRRGVMQTPTKQIPLKQIGKGMFATAYLTPEDRVLAVVAPNVYDKELLATAHRTLPNNPHIPAVEWRAHTPKGEQVYEMPRYKAPLKPAELNPEDRKAWKTLKSCIAKVHPLSANTGYDLTNKRIECMEQEGMKPSVLEAIQHITDLSADYGNTYTLEASPRNAAVDAHGNLVLLDIFFDKEQAQRARVARMKRANARGRL